MTTDTLVRARSLPLASVIVMTVGLILAMSPDSRLGMWPGTALAAAVGLSMALATALPEMRPHLVAHRRLIVAGVVSGAVMAVVTHASYPLAAALVPAVSGQTELLYLRLDSPPGLWAALPIVVLVVAAEEVVWRGVAYGAFERVVGRGGAAVLATLAYFVAQLGSETWLLPLLGLGCGAIWTAQRVLSGSIVVPLVTHLTWNVLVMVVFPVV